MKKIIQLLQIYPYISEKINEDLEHISRVEQSQLNMLRKSKDMVCFSGSTGAGDIVDEYIQSKLKAFAKTKRLFARVTGALQKIACERWFGIILLHFGLIGEPLTIKEIARLYDISPQYVRRKKKELLKKMNSMLF